MHDPARVGIKRIAPVHRTAVIAMAARFKVPTVYFAEYAVTDGGLLGYGVDGIDIRENQQQLSIELTRKY